MTFMIAMKASFSASLCNKFASCRSYDRTLVVSRLSSPKEILTVSDAGPITDDIQFAILTTRVAVGLRVRHVDGVSETFHLLRKPPETVGFSAPFVPLLGETELVIQDNKLTLSGEFELLTRPQKSQRCRWRVAGHHILWAGELAPSSGKWL